MIFLSILLFLFFGLVLVLLFTKGTLLFEFGQLPYFLWRVSQVSLNGMSREKYCYGSNCRQYFLLFESEKTRAANKPMIVYYHGGGWTFGSPEQFAANAKFFTDLGYPVIMPSYRRLPFYSGKAISQDRISTLKKITAILQEKNWSDKKIIMGGLSAGANVAALMALDKAALEDLNFDASRFAGLMLHGAPLDLSNMLMTPVVYAYAGKPGSKMFQQVNPICHLNQKPEMPILIIQGKKDGLVSFRNVDAFVKKCKELEVKVLDYHVIPNGTHLDTARWSYEENNSSAWIRNWLERL
jgi:acetyl esterase/lipase